MTKAFEEGTAHYGASGHQTGGKVNFVAVGSSATSNMGDDYYSQNFYDISHYKKSLDKNVLPTFRGMKLNEDDKIRQHATQQLRSYFRIDYDNFRKNFKIEPKEYFKKEIDYLSEMISDGLVNVDSNGITMTGIGKDFSQNISNVFDRYDPPYKSYTERLETIKKAKELQSKLLDQL